MPFLFSTRLGTISGEYADSQGDIKSTTILMVDHSSQGAEYTGLALLTPDCCAPYLAAADFHRGFIETFTPFFAPLGIPGAFIDPNLPAGYSPWNVQVVGDKVFVAYALQSVGAHDPVLGAGNGIVDIYNLDGSFARRFASNGPLNVPSTIVQASGNFGAFSNDVLIGNFADGVINAFDPSTGQYLGALKDGNGNPIANQQLHSMIFGDGTVGKADTLYLTAAPAGETSGIFAALAVNTSGTGPDFTLTSDRQSVTVAPGQIGYFSVKATPAGNFRNSFSFSCHGPAAVVCTVSSPSFDPTTGSAVVAVSATATTTPVSNVVAGFLLFVFMGMGWRRRRRFFYAFVCFTAGLAIVLGGVTGCGSSGGGKMVPQPTVESFSVTATAGSVSHTTVLMLNVQ